MFGVVLYTVIRKNTDKSKKNMKTVEIVIMGIIGVLFSYRAIYMVLGFFVKPRVFDKAPENKKYGVVIAARNEEKVIGLLLDSLKEQSYPKNLYDIFVVADNCTDKTAEIARDLGAIVYERSCPEKARKGFALEFLFDKIQCDYGITSYDGYLFFDADNVVANDYLEQMNNAFATGADCVVGYRNTKNFDRNFISAQYGIHFMRSSMSLHRPRSRLGLSTHITGTGFLLSSELVKDGWHYSTLTEDTQATMDLVVRRKRIEYCEAAEFYDEQPYQLSVAVRQRIRWAKGRLTCFFRYGYKLLAEVFKTDKNTNRLSSKLSCLDMFLYLLPGSFITKISGLILELTAFIIGVRVGEFVGANAVEYIVCIMSMIFGSLFAYFQKILQGLAIVVRERKHIRCSNAKLAVYLLTWPLYDIIYAYLCLASLFMRVKWKPIKHDEAISIDQLKK